MTTNTTTPDSEHIIQERRLLVQIRLSVGGRGRPERLILLNALRINRGAPALTEAEAIDLAAKTAPLRIDAGPGDVAMDAESAKELTWARISVGEWHEVELRRKRQIAARKADMGF